MLRYNKLLGEWVFGFGSLVRQMHSKPLLRDSPPPLSPRSPLPWPPHRQPSWAGVIGWNSLTDASQHDDSTINMQRCILRRDEQHQQPSHLGWTCVAKEGNASMTMLSQHKHRAFAMTLKCQGMAHLFMLIHESCPVEQLDGSFKAEHGFISEQSGVLGQGIALLHTRRKLLLCPCEALKPHLSTAREQLGNQATAVVSS